MPMPDADEWESAVHADRSRAQSRRQEESPPLARHFRIDLNRAGKRMGRDNAWNEARVRAFRSNHGIEVYREGERAERGELNELEAAQVLLVHAE